MKTKNTRALIVALALVGIASKPGSAHTLFLPAFLPFALFREQLFPHFLILVLFLARSCEQLFPHLSRLTSQNSALQQEQRQNTGEHPRI